MWECDYLLKQSQHIIILNTLLAALLLVSYIPQIYRFITQGSTFGVSIYYVAFNVLVIASQLTNTLYYSAYNWKELQCVNSNGLPQWSDYYRGPEVTGFAAYSILLSLIQLAIVWLFSLIVFVCYTMQPLKESSRNFWLKKSIDLPDSSSTRASKFCLHSLNFTAAIWTIVLLVPAALICLPGPGTINEQFTLTGIIHAVQSCITVPAVFIFTILGYIPQIRLTWMSKGQTKESVLSIATLALHVVAFIWLAITRIIRLNPLPNHDTSRFPEFPSCHSWDCYFRFGWYWFNPILYGVGQGVLLGICLYGRYTNIGDGNLMGDEDLGEGEREPLCR